MRKNMLGFSLIEMMIALTVTMVMTIGVALIYAGQIRTFSQTARKAQTTQEAQSAFEVVASLVRQAEMCLTCINQQTVSITNPAANSVQVDFTVPAGYPVWPNDVSPYTNNAMRIEWSSGNKDLRISAGSSVLDAPTLRTPIAIAGATGNMNTKITDFTIWPMVVDTAGAVTAGALSTTKPTAGYRIAMTAKVGTAESKTLTYERVILPRNW